MFWSKSSDCQPQGFVARCPERIHHAAEGIGYGKVNEQFLALFQDYNAVFGIGWQLIAFPIAAQLVGIGPAAPMECRICSSAGQNLVNGYKWVFCWG